MRPFQQLPKHVTALQSLTTDDAAAFVCLLYGFILLKPDTSQSKKSASLSNTSQSHEKKYVASKWKRADETSHTGDASPTDYRWKLNQNCFEPDWFQGSSVLESLTSEPTSLADTNSTEATSSDEEESESDDRGLE